METNLLSIHCVNASTVNMFKNKVDTHLRRAGSTHVELLGSG